MATGCRAARGSHKFSVDVLRQFRGHPFALVFETLRSRGFPIRARDGLLIPEFGYELIVRADRESVTYSFQLAETKPEADQLSDGV